jgi:hypothetical protein
LRGWKFLRRACARESGNFYQQLISLQINQSLDWLSKPLALLFAGSLVKSSAQREQSAQNHTHRVRRHQTKWEMKFIDFHWRALSRRAENRCVCGRKRSERVIILGNSLSPRLPTGFLGRARFIYFLFAAATSANSPSLATTFWYFLNFLQRLAINSIWLIRP